ncbi:MAG TPA: hypothetical protein PK282_04165 [Rhodoglobus sp.]|nr:hypothetical protein [Rhodoglobus sp.]HPM51409.1 hypothetical protein [Rhodoglobus sp.]
MTGRVLGVVLQAVIGTVLTVVLAGLYFMLILGMGPSEAFLDQAIRLVLGFVDIGIVTWVVLLIVGAARRRGLGWGIGGSLLAALIGAVVNLIWIVILSVINGGADIFAIALGVQAGIFFLIAVATTAPLVLRVFVRR